jgi:hypothetical protein
MKILRFVTLVLLLASGACTYRSTPVIAARTPEETVKAFVELSATAKEPTDKKKLQDLCQGELRRTFERMTEEAFKLLYLDSKIKITELKVIEATAQADAAKVHYSVSVQNDQGTDPTQEVNEREVDLVRSQGNWFIDTIRMKGNDRVAFTRGMIF